MIVTFFHGAGKAGASAWPRQVAEAEQGWVFLERLPTGDDPENDASRIVMLLADAGGGHVVAHSYGAMAALLAAGHEPELVRSLALLEPACFDLARGCPAVEEHIATMTPVFAAAADEAVTWREFSALFAAAMGTEVPDLPDTVLEAQVTRLRTLTPPWGTGLTAMKDLPVPTLVVTGGWSELYEQTAAALADYGAQREVVAGSGHRVQDAAVTNGLLRDFWQAIT